jgi:hypothetical protein
MDCDTALVLKATGRPASPMAIDFLNNVALVTYAADYEAFFDHHDKTDCPVTSCKLRTADCSADLPVNTNFYQTLTSSNTVTVAPYQLFAKQNINDGWTNINFCYKCTGTKYEGGTYFT